jgi:hypothetical protein
VDFHGLGDKIRGLNEDCNWGGEKGVLVDESENLQLFLDMF